MDTVAIFAAGVKRYLFTAIDVRTRFAFACAYKSNSSGNGSDFLGKFLQVVPFVARRIQTDNGSEFLKHFDQLCQKKRLTHFFNYPKHPQSNGYLERFNRTVQEQFVYANIDYIDETTIFNRYLMEYLIWYNTERSHRGIDKVPHYAIMLIISYPKFSLICIGLGGRTAHKRRLTKLKHGGILSIFTF